MNLSKSGEIEHGTIPEIHKGYGAVAILTYRGKVLLTSLDPEDLGKEELYEGKWVALNEKMFGFVGGAIDDAEGNPLTTLSSIDINVICTTLSLELLQEIGASITPEEILARISGGKSILPGIIDVPQRISNGNTSRKNGEYHFQGIGVLIEITDAELQAIQAHVSSNGRSIIMFDKNQPIQQLKPSARRVLELLNSN